ncbi:tRNA (adenosine(37)-N6)-threonylcarbamoyltransferase complex dimerization subunit type 1 TsaB [Marimonas sp. MJW-29]|uniref:tRNA (Adenosine(37)-N6)-threonylcarbamoyltransferase complex dimerization subunit type 1 TsaB n=1 Tax=Sulfitobacter sediminis TaxID=3234186 RepID=A0ABV3RQ24_9RHOB
MPDKGFPENRKKWPKVVAFDTSGPFVSVGWSTESYSGGSVKDMPRGQAETLMPALEDTLASCGWTWADVDAIGVGVGPGNFTGIRIAVSAARGLGLALGIPVFGITAFECAYGTIPVPPGTLVSVPATRGLVYLRGYGTGASGAEGQGLLIDPSDPPRELRPSPDTLVFGHRATEIAAHLGTRADDEEYRPDPARLAEMTEQKYIEATAFPPRPVPDYIKPPDAAPARDAPPAILP